MSNRERTRALFESKAQDWHLKYNVDGALRPRLIDIIDQLGPARGRSLLDFGCASGNMASALSSLGFIVTGCDMSQSMIEEARRQFGNSVDFHVVEQVLLPLEAASFDVVIAVSVLEYVDDTTSTLAELARILKKGGLFLATVPNQRHPIRWMEAALRHAMPAIDYSQLPCIARVGIRLNNYRAYLTVSGQRKGRPGWAQVIEESGLRDVEIRTLPSKKTMLLVTASKGRVAPDVLPHLGSSS